MKKALKTVGTALLLILVGAVIYFVSATVYYRTTGDGRHSGTLGLRCTMIYVIALLAEGFIRRMRRLKTEGVLLGYSEKAPDGGISPRRRSVNRTAAWLYGSVLCVLISFMLYYIVPEYSPLEDAAVWISVFSGFLTVICAGIYIISRLSAASGDRADARAEKLRAMREELYGEFPEQKQYIEREYSYRDLCAALTAMFGADSPVRDLIDPATGKLREGVSYDEVLERVDSAPGLLQVPEFFFHSPQAMRTEVNLLCERAKNGVNITEKELAGMMAQYDTKQDIRRRIDYQLPWIHDMNLIDRILRAKGYALVYITACFTDDEDINAYYETGEEPEEYDDWDDEVTERRLLAVCTLKSASLALG